MDLFWREHKRFILGVAGALAFGYFLYLFVISPARKARMDDQEKLQSLRKQLAQQLETRGQPTDDILARATEDLGRIEKSVRMLAADLTMDVPREFVVPKTEKNPSFYFDTQFNRVKLELKRRAPKAGRDGVRLPPDDRFGFATPPGPQSAPESLIRLSLIQRLVQSAFEIAQKLRDAPAVEVIGLQAIPGSGKDATAPPANRFMQRHPVEVQIKTGFVGFLSILHTLGQKGGFLALDRIRFVKDDHMAAVGTADFAISGLMFNAQGNLSADAADGEAGGERAAPSFRRRGG
jgi:hypothetical protein